MDEEKRLFAGRGITPRGALVVAGIVVGAFALGIGVGWGTSLVGDQARCARSVRHGLTVALRHSGSGRVGRAHGTHRA
ncbi:hypothetical protein GCM10025876_26560 [Demequina litorisediminis]|uniref:Uncharacterized protein n=1 Tax=Demequina litorisediminis TaxID=1849022 RepID=A0ABQ6IH05_9MICO|nr:hypothetical protein GCM10025876_26560 [Demequina litorisediminis]